MAEPVTRRAVPAGSVVRVGFGAYELQTLAEMEPPHYPPVEIIIQMWFLD